MKSLILMSVLLMNLGPGSLRSGELTFKVHVIDADTQEPLKGVPVCAWYDDMTLRWKDGVKSSKIKKCTGPDGTTSFSGHTNCGKVWCTVHMDGYYDAQQVKLLGSKGETNAPGLMRFWNPQKWIVTNDAHIALRKINNPIKLCAKHELPRESEEFLFDNAANQSYDLLLGDWLPPLGNGKVADVTFTHKRIDRGQVRTHNNGESLKNIGRDEVELCFVGDDNGLVESIVNSSETLRIRIAPENGYKSEHLIWAETDKDLKYSSSEDWNRCFAFRVRTRRNAKGEIVEAYYGKIYGNPKIDGGGSYLLRGIEFNYYINPKSLDRNLEWDRKNNGFKGRGPLYMLP